MAKFPRRERLDIKTIAKKQKVPAAFLRKIFQRLSKERMIGSKRGPGGGFYLLKGAHTLTLREILESTQGRISLNDCLFDDGLCDRSKECRIRKELSSIQKRVIKLLDGYTLSDFCEGEIST